MKTKTKITEKNGMLRQLQIIEMDDGGPQYSGNSRYLEFNVPELPTIGKTYMVWSREYVGPRRGIQYNDDEYLVWSDDPDLIENGLGGNTNSSIRRFNGWRGTSEDVAVYARGVRECTQVVRREFKQTVHYSIQFGPSVVTD